MRGLLATLFLGLLTACACQESHTPLGGSSDANLPPVMRTQPDTSASLGDTLCLRARADDPDGDLLSYRLTTHVTRTQLLDGHLPDAHIEASTGQFWFMPLWYDQPSRTFTFHAQDGLGGADSTAFKVTVNGASDSACPCAQRPEGKAAL